MVNTPHLWERLNVVMAGIENPLPVDENKPSIKNLKKSERVFTWFLDHYYKYISRREIKVDPFDSVILKAHHSFTSYLMLTVFVLVTSHWFIEEPIICIDRSDRSQNVPENLLDICASYPFVEYPFNNDKNKMVRRYALHYRWVHIACLILSFVFKGIIIFQKIFFFRKHRNMLEELCKAKLHDRFWIAKRYFSNHIGCHRKMYFNFLVVHFFALLINILVFTGLNITFQNQYWDLPKNLFITRNPTSFHDPYSLIFPPFVQCEIKPIHHINVLREKDFGCHLPLMEIYEKIFMIFWFWQIFLGIWTILYLLLHIPFPFCRMWKRYLLITSSFNSFNPYKAGSKHFATDDIFALNSITTLILGDEFDRLLNFLLGMKSSLNESLDPDETIYYDHNQSNNKSLDNSTFFHSCLPDKDKNTPPIGFEGLLSRTNVKAEISPTSQPLMFSTPDRTSYNLWKRSVSLEFGIAAENTNSLSFNSKITPLIHFLNRDCKLSKNSSCLDNVPKDCKNESFKTACAEKPFVGGEKSFPSPDRNEILDRDWSETQYYNWHHNQKDCWDYNQEAEFVQNNEEEYSQSEEIDRHQNQDENWDSEVDTNCNQEISNWHRNERCDTTEANSEVECWDKDYNEESYTHKWQ
ncbi:UNVERIFIED_CONTAM: hypothetical protein RMT77_010739 [Armadillidium vulgare]